MNRHDWNPSDTDPGMKIGCQWTRRLSKSKTTNKEFLKNYLPNIDDEIHQFPMSSFHNQADKHLISIGCVDVESELTCDESVEEYFREVWMRADEALKARQDSMEKEQLCRRIRLYAEEINARPSLILSHYAYSIYLRRYGPDLRDFAENSIHNDKLHDDLKSDCTWISPHKNAFGISIDTIKKDATNRTNWPVCLKRAMTAAWRQSTLTGLFLRSLISDLPFEYSYHPVTAFPNLSSETTNQFLCLRIRWILSVYQLDYENKRSEIDEFPHLCWVDNCSQTLYRRFLNWRDDESTCIQFSSQDLSLEDSNHFG